MSLISSLTTLDRLFADGPSRQWSVPFRGQPSVESVFPGSIHILPVEMPSERIVSHVFSYAMQRSVISYDMLVVVALPQAAPERLPAGSPDLCRVVRGRDRFEPMNHVRQ